MLLRRRFHTSKPMSDVEPTGPIADGLIGAVLINEGGGLQVRDWSRTAGHATITGTGLTWAYGSNGPVISCLGTTTDYLNISSIATKCTPAEHSVMMRLRLDTTAAGVRTAISIRFDGNNETAVDFGVAAGSLRLQGFWNGTGKNVSFTPTLSQWYTVALTYSTSRDEMRGYVDGVQLGTTQTGLGVPAVTPTSGRIGNDVFDERWLGLIDYCYIWNRALAPREIQELTVQPFRMFQARRRIA